MGYWNKSLYRDSLTARTNNMLTDLNLEVFRLSSADTAFSDLAYNMISTSPSVKVIQGIAQKYQSVVDGFMTAADYDAVDCHTLLGYISNEPEDLIFGELYGQYEVAKQNRDNAATSLSNLNEHTALLIIGGWTAAVYYQHKADSYQDEMDALQRKLDHLGEFDDLCGALFANSVDFRTNAINAMADLQDCVSSDGTFKDIGYSSALNNLEELHEQRQAEYLNQWLDENGEPDMDAVETFLYQDPDSIPMDQMLAFCEFMDGLSDEQMTEVMNMSTRVIHDYEIDYASPSYIEVSQVMQEAAALNSALWCARYAVAGYDRSGFDEDAMLRAIAIDCAMQQLDVMAEREREYIDPNGEIYQHLPVYVDGSNVYILPHVARIDAVVDEDVTEIFKRIIANDTDDFNPYLNTWVNVGVNNESTRDFVIDNYLAGLLDRLGGGDGVVDVTTGKIKDKIKDKIVDQILSGLKENLPGVGAVSIGLDMIKFYAELQEEYLKINANQNGQETLAFDIFCEAFFLNRGTYVTFTGPGYTSSVQIRNPQFDSGDLQLAIAAYNEYNGGMDIDINWIYNYEHCTDAQKEAVALYVDWYHNCQNGNQSETIETYRSDVESAYFQLRIENNIMGGPAYDELTPAQFREVQNYMADPNYRVDTSLWE